jgi:hypothetical protein
MTDIQRYAMTGHDETDAWLAPDDDGLWVLYADHVEAAQQAVNDAIAAAVQRVEVLLPEVVTSELGRGYEMGVRAALDALKDVGPSL